MGPNYGTNKIQAPQQNPMLSRQLCVSISLILISVKRGQVDVSFFVVI